MQSLFWKEKNATKDIISKEENWAPRFKAEPIKEIMRLWIWQKRGGVEGCEGIQDTTPEELPSRGRWLDGNECSWTSAMRKKTSKQCQKTNRHETIWQKGSSYLRLLLLLAFFFYNMEPSVIQVLKQKQMMVPYRETFLEKWKSKKVRS